MQPVMMRRDRKLDYLPVNKIVKNERNPRERSSFTDESLDSLIKSVDRHGFLQPLIVQPYNDDDYLLIEGERRLTVAGKLGISEVPAIVVKRLDEVEQLTVMFNVHTQRKGWEVAEEMLAIREMRERNPALSDEDMARDLGISTATLRDRLQVLGMGDEVVTKIAKDKIEYSSALRADQIAKSLVRKRPEVAERLGGHAGITKKLIQKAERRKSGGISQELVAARKDLVDPDALPDDLVEEYVTSPHAKLREVQRKAESLAERRMVEDLVKEVNRVEREIYGFKVELSAAPNLRDLRHALARMLDTASKLETRVVEALLEADEKTGR